MASISTFVGTAKSILLSWLLIFITGSVFSQPVITGKITGRDGIALPGATVFVKGTKNNSTTDSSGHFIIRANPGNVIEFSFVGYYNRQIILSEPTTVKLKTG